MCWLYWPLKLPWPLKIGHPKRKLVFQPSISRCYVSFREGNRFKIIFPRNQPKTNLPNTTFGASCWYPHKDANVSGKVLSYLFSDTSLNTIPTQHHSQTRDCQQHTAKTKHKGRKDTVTHPVRATSPFQAIKVNALWKTSAGNQRLFLMSIFAQCICEVWKRQVHMRIRVPKKNSFSLTKQNISLFRRSE